MKKVLIKNVLNPKFRPVAWCVVAVLASLPMLSHPTAQRFMHGETDFTFYDNKGSVVCILNHWFVSTTWECTNHSGIDLVENVSTEPKFWEYEIDDGKVVVERNNHYDGVSYEVTHPAVELKLKTTVN